LGGRGGGAGANQRGFVIPDLIRDQESDSFDRCAPGRKRPVPGNKNRALRPGSSDLVRAFRG